MHTSTLRPWLLLALLVLTTNAFAQLKVNGRYLYDQCGEKIVMRGVNEMLVYSSDRTGAVTYPEIAKTGANAVRFMWFTDASVPASALDANAKNAVANGLIPIPGLWDATGKWGADFEKCVAWWTSPAIVTVCKNNPYLVVNIANEAGGSVMADYTSMYANAIGRIRNAGITNVIMVDADRYGRNWQTISDKGAAVLAADPQRNVMFSWHPWDTNMDYATPINTIAAKNLCLVVGEFSYKSVGCTCCINYKQIIATAQTQGVGTLAWSWGLNKNGDCADGSMDMTTNGTFAGLKAGWPTEISTTDPNSIKNTSVRPYSIRNAGKCATTAVDTQAPTVPPALASSNVTSSSFTLTWTASADNVGVTAYDVYRGGTFAGSSSTTSFNVTGLSASTAYSMTVRAKDAAGNVSAASTALSVTTSAASGTTYTRIAGTAFGTGPWSGCPTCTFDKAFDGNTATYFDAAAADGAYTGIDAGSGKTVTRIRFYPRTSDPGRMVGGKFQGSNTSSSAGFADLYTVPSQPTVAWQEVNLSNATAYRYLRYLAPAGGYGNVAEVEFYTGGTTTTPPATVSLNDATVGTGTNQFEFVGAWNTSTGTGKYNGDDHYTNTVGAYYQVRFNGTQVSIYAAKAGHHGIAGVSIDGGAEVNVDCYAATRAENVLLWTSPALAAGDHIIKVRATGTKNASSTGTYIAADRLDVTSGGARIAAGTTGNEAAEAVRISPNPARDQVRVDFVADAPGKALVAVLDARARRQLQTEKAVVRGGNSLTLPVHALRKGLYFVVVQVDGKRITRKLVVE